MWRPKASADVEGGGISGPDADHEEDEELFAVTLLAVPDHRDKCQRISNIDQAEEAERGVGQDAVELSAEGGPGQQDEAPGR